ncbi:MAG: LPP20 family lipoprotein, partial [Gammaproteobacteria bacterium]|nr:LPP20 family lipoprotein [Gammaproteobacteria bacterium]
MLKLIKISCVVIFTYNISTFSLIASAAPEWFGNLTAKDGRLIGYGTAALRSQAKAKALSDISEQISIDVKSQTSITTQQDGSSVSKHQFHKIKTQSNKRISQAHLLKQQYYQNKYFQAWQVDLRSSVNIMAEKLLKKYQVKPASIRWNSHPEIEHSPFLKDLKRLLVGDSDKELSLNVSLNRKHDSWLLTIDNIVMALDDS